MSGLGVRKGRVVIRFGGSDNWRGVVLSVRRDYATVQWQDMRVTEEPRSSLLPIVAADPRPRP